MRSLLSFALSKKDSKLLYGMKDIEKAIKVTLEELEGIKIEKESDRIKNFFNDKFLRSMKKELNQIEESVNDLTQSQKKIMESLDTYMEGIKKKFEERIDAAKMFLFDTILQKSVEVNTHLSDLTISSTQLQKKLISLKQDFVSTETVLKTSIPEMLKSFLEYKSNLVKIRDEYLVEGVINQICSRIDAQTEKCVVQIHKLLENNLHPDQILVNTKAEIPSLSSLSILDLDDTRSMLSYDEDDRSLDRKY